MYEVTIDNFQGPLDLLLHLIKESKMDILNIELGLIIDEYLKYIKKMQDMNLDVASSYLVMSCELLEIKSRMLLPKMPSEEPLEDDPRENLINRLLEYQQYKDKIGEFRQLEGMRGTYYTKVPSSISEVVSSPQCLLHDVTLDDLVASFKNFLERSREDEPISTKITKRELSVEDMMIEVMDSLNKCHKMKFGELFKENTKEYLVVTFLAILELAKKGVLKIIQEDNFSDILCEVANG